MPGASSRDDGEGPQGVSIVMLPSLPPSAVYRGLAGGGVTQRPAVGPDGSLSARRISLILENIFLTARWRESTRPPSSACRLTSGSSLTLRAVPALARLPCSQQTVEPNEPGARALARSQVAQ